MRISLPVPSTRRPVGGVAITYEFAAALAARGHETFLIHHDLFGDDAHTGLHDIDWFTFDPAVEHVFVHNVPSNIAAIPDADIIVAHSPEILATPRLGLAVSMIQGWRMYPEDQELSTFRRRGPKACVATWLRRVGIGLGVPAEHLIHTPIAVRHDRFALHRPVADREPHVVFCWNSHAQKGGRLGLETFRRLHETRPGVRLSAFGTERPRHVPDWLEFHELPAHDVLVHDLYNTATIFLCSSVVEGFGLTNVEAMACGAALVTTDCGGPRDYAEPDVSALFSPSEDVDALVANVHRLLDDEPGRVRIAEAGLASARAFTWERSAEIMEDFLHRYLDDPPAFGW